MHVLGRIAVLHRAEEYLARGSASGRTLHHKRIGEKYPDSELCRLQTPDRINFEGRGAGREAEIDRRTVETFGRNPFDARYPDSELCRLQTPDRINFEGRGAGRETEIDRRIVETSGRN